MEATIQGCRIFYELHRPHNTASPVVLLLHGWGCDGSVFSFLHKGFTDATAWMTVDFPAHGKSAEPPEPWGVTEYAEQLVALLAQLAIDRVQIVAHSFGGRVALYMASHYPELVDKMVITGGAGIRKPLSEARQKRQAQYKRMNKVLDALKRFGPLKNIVEKQQAALRKRFGSSDYAKLSETMRKTFVKVISEDLSPLLPKVAAPTLLVWGSDDTETPLWMGQQMEKAIPDAGLVVFEGGSHFAFAQQPQRFLLIVKQFFWGGMNG